jgi:hypothetical protein
LSLSAVLSIINYNIYKISYYKLNFFNYLVSTNPTNLKDHFSNTKDLILDFNTNRLLSLTTLSSKEVSTAILNILDILRSENKTKSVCYNALIRPLKLHKFVLSPFLRWVSVSVLLPASSVLNAPRFNLLLIYATMTLRAVLQGWADLLRLKEKNDRAVNSPAWIRDGCTENWNQGCARGPEW